MNSPSKWNEILAAYADGELEGRDDLALLKQRVEHWLAAHPEAREELVRLRELKDVWGETSPPLPNETAWQEMLAELERVDRRAPTGNAWRRIATAFVAAAACCVLGVSLWLANRPGPAAPVVPDDDDSQPFRVAAAHEVEIMHVEGADTQSLVVGELPVKGPLELAVPGEVTVTSVQPAARDNMMPEVRVQGPGRPMIWARLD